MLFQFAIIAILYSLLEQEELTGEYTYNLVRIVPYNIVLITALLGMNVIVVLLLGTGMCDGVIGFITGVLLFPHMLKL